MMNVISEMPATHSASRVHNYFQQATSSSSSSSSSVSVSDQGIQTRRSHLRRAGVRAARTCKYP